MATQTAKDVLKYAKENKVEAVDLKFLDFLGIWQHFTIPTSELNEDLFEEGNGFDGSSIRGWQPINASDMLVVPDPTTAAIDPFIALPTLSLICNIVDPITKEAYSRDPRNIARKADAYLKSTGIGDVAYFGPEPEFFVFDEVRYEQNHHTGFYVIDSAEGQWNTGRKTDTVNDRSGKVVESLNLGYKPRYKEGYFPVAPTDTQQDIRAEMVREMEKVGIRVEKHHHEVATAARPRSTCASCHSSRWATRSCGTSTSSRTSRAGTTRRPRSCRSRSSSTTAPACMSTNRSGRARSRCSRATGTAA